jgi:hypothetical protein
MASFARQPGRGVRAYTITKRFQALRSTPGEILSIATTWNLLRLFAALVALDPNAEDGQVKKCAIEELYPGMIIQQDVQSNGGTLLVSAGQEVTPAVISKLKNFHARGSIEGFVKVSAAKSSLSFVKGA